MDKKNSAILTDDEKNPLVKYDRRFSAQFRQINAFNKVDQDLFFSTLSIIREKKQTTVTITGKELMQRSGYLKKNVKQFTKEQLIKLIDTMTDHINSCYIYMHDPDRDIDRKIFLFQSFEINRKTADFTASLTPMFSHYFFNIQDFLFTRFALHGFLILKSKYSKVLYRMFLDNYGGMEISTANLFEMLGIENKHSSQKQFIYRLPIYLKEIEEKTGDFIGPIKYQIIKDDSRGQNNPKGKYKSIIFAYTERPGRVIEANVDDLPLCPYCHQELTWRKNKTTGKEFIGHKDFLHSACKIKGFNDIEDLQKQIAAEEKKRSEKLAAKENAKNNDPIYKALMGATDAHSDLPKDFDPESYFDSHLKS